MSAEICIITFTVDRVPQLIRCIQSVMSQDITIPLRHVVFSENSAALLNDHRLEFYRNRIEIIHLDGVPNYGQASPRMANLRNFSLSYVKEPYVCFLDDDNEMERHHLSSLFNAIQHNNVIAAYSWRVLLHHDSTLFNCNSYPWHPDASEAKKRWEWCVRAGVMVPGDAVMRDGPVSIPDPMNLATVDMNEWLFKTEALKEIKMEFNFSNEDILNKVGEDDKLFSRIRLLNLPVVSTQLPTIRYYLGGVSNSNFN